MLCANVIWLAAEPVFSAAAIALFFGSGAVCFVLMLLGWLLNQFVAAAVVLFSGSGAVCFVLMLLG